MNANYYTPTGGRWQMTLTAHLVIINALMLLATTICAMNGIDLDRWLGLHYVGSERYAFWQPVTYMFMHGGFMHLFFNMWSLFMFGQRLEADWGRQRFLTYYFVTGIGAAVMQQLAWRYGIVATWMSELHMTHAELMAYSEQGMHVADYLVTVGASGSVFGILLAYGMTYPNDRVMLLIPPMPLKVKWLVVGYGLFELWAGVSSKGDNIAHFAHLGGMLFGWLLILWWRRRGRRQDGWPYGRPASGGKTLMQRIRSWVTPKPRMEATPGGRYATGAEQRRDMDYNQRQRERRQRIDEILDKISRSGYDKLTDEEKQILFDASNQK